MTRLIVALFLLSAARPAAAADPLPRARPESVGVSSARLARIRPALEKEVAEGKLPGAVVAVARRGKLVYFEAIGYLDKTTGARMPKDAIFTVASMTKPFTGVATLILQEEGRLHLAEPAAKYLPPVGRMKVAATDTVPPKLVPPRVPITIQDLMRHTAGMAYGWGGSSPLYKLWPNSPDEFAREDDPAGFLAKLEAMPLLHQPSTIWEYSVANDVLGLLVEAVAQKPLGQFLQERVFQPLGMPDTGFVIPPEKVARWARALPNDPETRQPQTMMDSTKAHRWDCGGACAVSTAGDYLRFAEMLRQRGHLGTVRVLGRKSVELMTSDHLGTRIVSPAVEDDPTRWGGSYGLTVSVRTQPGVSPYLGSVGEFGWGGAYGTQFWVDPHEELVVVFMAHVMGNLRPHYRQLIGSLVLQAID